MRNNNLQKNMRKNILAIAVFCFLLQIFPGSLFASQNYQSDVRDRLEQEQLFIVGPRWMIPFTFNPKNEDFAQDRLGLLRASDKNQRTKKAQEQSEALPLKGPKGGGPQTGAVEKTGSVKVEAQNNGEAASTGETWKEIGGDGGYVKKTGTIFLDKDGRSYLTETFINDELVEKQAVICLDKEGLRYMIFTAQPQGGGTYDLEAKDVYIGSYYEMSGTSLVKKENEEDFSYSDFFQNTGNIFNAQNFVELQQITNTFYDNNDRVTGYNSIESSYGELVASSAYSIVETIDEPCNIETGILPIDQTIVTYVLGSSVKSDYINKEFESFGKLSYVSEGDAGTGDSPITSDMRETGTLVTGTINTAPQSALTGYEYSSSSKTDIFTGTTSNEARALAAPSRFCADSQSDMLEKKALYDEALTRASDYTHSQNLKYIESAAKAKLETETSAHIIDELGSKKELTYTEAGLLEASQAVLRDSEYIDEETMKNFTETAYYLRIAESMKEILEGVDFNMITKALEGLVKEQSALYDRFLSSTKDAYDEIVRLLALKADDEKLPDRYECLPDLNIRAKLKIITDIRLRGLMEKEIERLNENEKEAVKIYNGSIRQFQNEYKEDITRILDKFTFEVRKALINTEGATATEEGGQFKALFLLENKSK